MNGVEVSGRRESSEGALGEGSEGKKTQRVKVGKDSRGEKSLESLPTLTLTVCSV